MGTTGTMGTMKTTGHRRMSTVRARLTLWNVGVMLLVLAVYAAGVFAFVRRSASLSLDERVRSDFNWANEMWEQKPDGSFAWFEGELGHQDSPWLTVWSPDGRLLYRTSFAAWYPIADSARLVSEASGAIVRAPSGSTTFRVLTGSSHLAGQPVVIQVARSEAPMFLELRELVLFLALGLPLAVLVAGAGGYWMARHALAPAERMAERASSITADRLSERLPVANPHDEFGRLAGVFNDTFARLEGVFAQMQRFTSDVSHELRTPLTAIRTVGEVGLRERRDERAYREIIGRMLEEADRLVCLVTRLLTWSRIDSGQARPSIDPIDLHELAEDVAVQLGVLAEEKRQTIQVLSSDSARCRGDRVLLHQALSNLVDNAIKYTPEGGRIEVRVSATPSQAIVDVTDTGLGISNARQVHIFDRFYQADPSETVGGVGLGLSIAKRAVEAMGGKLQLQTSGRAGSTFRIALPVAAGASVESTAA
jgi:heavy metal sensor kinase